MLKKLLQQAWLWVDTQSVQATFYCCGSAVCSTLLQYNRVVRVTNGVYAIAIGLHEGRSYHCSVVDVANSETVWKVTGCWVEYSSSQNPDPNPKGNPALLPSQGHGCIPSFQGSQAQPCDDVAGVLQLEAGGHAGHHQGSAGSASGHLVHRSEAQTECPQGELQASTVGGVHTSLVTYMCACLLGHQLCRYSPT